MFNFTDKYLLVFLKEAASSYLRVAAALHVVPYLYALPPGKINEEMRRKPGSFPSYKFTHTYKFRC